MNTNTHKTPNEDIAIHESDALKAKVKSVRRFSSSTLFEGAKEIVIAHLGEVYMLTITKQKKLLLTKIKQDFLL